MAETKRKTKAKRRKTRPERCTFVIKVMDWGVNYSFSLGNEKYDPGPFADSLQLEVQGVIREPEKYAGHQLTATFVGHRDLIGPPNRPWPEPEPTAVGATTLRGAARDFIGGLPFDSFPAIVSLLQTKKLGCLHFHGSSPDRGHSKIRYVHFVKEYKPEEL